MSPIHLYQQTFLGVQGSAVTDPTDITLQLQHPEPRANYRCWAQHPSWGHTCSKSMLKTSSIFSLPTTQNHRSQGPRGLTGHHGKFEELQPAQHEEPSSSLLPKFPSDNALSPRKELRKGGNLFLFEANIWATKKTVKHKQMESTQAVRSC